MLSRTLLGKFARLRPRDWFDLVAAQIALLRAQLLVWTRRRGALVRPLHGPGPSDAAGETARSVALAVSRAAHYGLFRPRCLVRAVALQRMLQARGVSGSSLRVGVRRENGSLLAHAWVEYGGTVLGDEAWLVRQFDELAQMGVGEAP